VAALVALWESPIFWWGRGGTGLRERKMCQIQWLGWGRVGEVKNPHS